MSSNYMKLSEKTVVISGPLSPSVQAIMTTLVELGSDVALLTTDLNHGERFCANLRDLREAHPEFGRATAIDSNPKSANEAKNDISRAAEAFGGIDVYIDGNFSSQNTTFADENTLDKLEKVIEQNLKLPVFMVHGALQFLKGRSKGRIIFLTHEAVRKGHIGEGLSWLSQSGLDGLIKGLAKENQEFNITVNGISMGATEEYLLARDPEAKSVSEALEGIKKNFPLCQLVDSYEIAHTVSYLASPLSSGVTGQIIKVTRGMDL